MADMQEAFFDVVVVGAGGAGLRVAIETAAKGLSTACVSKVYPTRSHTVSAQGGISAALNNMGDGDHWRYHMHDTVKGSVWLGDQDAIEHMCYHAMDAVIELEHWGVPFSRTAEGLIYQRPFGGHTLSYGKKMAQRACAAADKTGHAILHTLYQKALEAGVTFFDEFFVLDLLMDPGQPCQGVLAWDLRKGQLMAFGAQNVVLATGGYGRVYDSCTSAYTCTGDGNAMILRACLPLQDMEFVQFHPTGLYKTGRLISEAVRGEGGYLTNKNGERFMTHYAPQNMDLAPRDVVSRAIMQEILKGNGDGPNGDHVWLHVHHLDPDMIRGRLPGIADISQIFAHVDVSKQPIPVVPTAHYTMGGIPTNLYGEVMNHEDIVQGLWAVGEAACISVHGANRLGTNSLLDLIVFGSTVAKKLVEQCVPGHCSPLDPALYEAAQSRFEGYRSQKGGPCIYEVREVMQKTMQEACAVFRTPEGLAKGIATLKSLYKEMAHMGLTDQGMIWNSELVDVLELDNLLLQALATAESALFRTESRGAHYRNDHPQRDDVNWLCHTLIWRPWDVPTFATRSVRFQTRYTEPIACESVAAH